MKDDFGAAGLRRFFRCSAVALLALFANLAQASVKLPNGEYRETVTDLRVKVLGGYVAVERTWLAENLNKGKYRWYVNPAWADLSFEYDDLDGSVKSVRRADSKFERAGNDVFVFERAYFIAKKDGGWRWYDRNGNWIRYDDKGRITAYGDRNDVMVHFVRDPDHKIATVTDHRGQPVLTFGYTGDKLTSITDRAGRKVAYRYEGSLIADVVDVGSNSWKYGYTNGLLTSETDAEGHTTTIAYSGNRVVKVTNPLQYAIAYEYAYDRGKREHTVVEKSPEGRRVERRYAFDGLLLRQIDGTREVYALKRQGESVHAYTDERGLQTRVEFDAVANPIKIVHADGTVATAKYDPIYNLPLEEIDERGTKTVSEYDAKGNLKKRTEAAGSTVQRVTTFDYDEYGQPKKRTVAGVAASNEWTYDDYGNMKTATDAERHMAEMSYDVMGNVLTRKDARGKTWAATYRPQGWLESTRDPLQNAVTLHYDKVGNLRERIDQESKATRYEYFDDDSVRSIADAAGGIREFAYDKDGNLVTAREVGQVTMTYRYDADGRLSEAEDAQGNTIALDYGAGGSDKSGLLARLRFPGYCNEYSYDQRRRVTRRISRTPCEGNERTSLETSYGYDAGGLRTSETDARHNTTVHYHDELGRLAKTVDALSGTTSFGYDELDNLLTVRDANGNTQRYAYDRTRRLLGETRPLGAAIAYAYDETGNLVRRVSPKGDRRVLDYDDAGRLVTERHYASNRNTAETTIVYDYDRRGILKGYQQTGSTSNSARFEFDDAGRRIAETTTFSAGGRSITKNVATQFYPSGLRRTLTYPEGESVSYTYTPHQRLEKMVATGIGEIRWADFDWMTARQVDFPGATREVDVDEFQRPKRIRVAAADGSTRMDEHYEYDEAGHLAVRTNDDGAYSYAYDALYRLVEAKPPASRGSAGADKYTYDAVHNRLSSVSQPGAWTYDADNRLLGYGIGNDAHRFEYDANGNVVADVASDRTTYEYDASERIVAVAKNGVPLARFQYDPFGRRIRTETATASMWLLYGDDGLLAEYSDTGEFLKRYGWEPGGAGGANPLWQATPDGGGSAYFYQNDSIGTPMRLLNRDGQTVWSARYAAFGKTSVDAASTADNALRFAGQFADAGLPVFNNRFRTYSPETGRYLETDPIGLAGGINTYAYVGGNPVNYVDPDGLEKLILFSYFGDQGMYAAAVHDPDRSGILTVYGHGNAQSVRDFAWFDYMGDRLDANQLAKKIRESGRWRKGMPIWLKACSTGSNPNGIAQKLANALGVIVYAPTDLVWYDEDTGTLGVAGADPNRNYRMDRSKPGEYRAFYPPQRPSPIRLSL